MNYYKALTIGLSNHGISELDHAQIQYVNGRYGSYPDSSLHDFDDYPYVRMAKNTITLITESILDGSHLEKDTNNNFYCYLTPWDKYIAHVIVSKNPVSLSVFCETTNWNSNPRTKLIGLMSFIRQYAPKTNLQKPVLTLI